MNTYLKIRSMGASVEPRLDKSEVQRWLTGQRETEKIIRKERTKALLSRTPEESWSIYLSLAESRFGAQRDLGKPSFVLAAMRRALDRQAQRNRSEK